MEKYFVTYNQALALKELGFDEPCLAFYQKEYTEETPVMIDDDYQYRLTGWRTCRNSEIPKHYTSAPLKSQVLEWFRNVHQLFGTVLCDLCWNISGGVANSYGDAYDWDSEKFNTYEEAESACIDKLIEIVKNK